MGEVRAIYRNEYYKDLLRWLLSRREEDKGQITDDEFASLSGDAVAEFHDSINDPKPHT